MRYKQFIILIYVVISCYSLLMAISFATEDNITAKDGSFIAFANGVVKDTKTNLDWIAGPDRDVTWDEVRIWVKELTVDGGEWRMPSKEELKTLYQKGAGTRNMTPLLKTTGHRVWSSETMDTSLAWAFDFFHSDENWVVRDTAYNTRGFAVRSRN